MKYIEKYAIFEKLTEKELLMGKILHLYGSIPVPKEKSSVVISKIVYSSGIRYTLGEPVSLNYTKIHDRVRFNDYFDSLINSKDSRGHNFEGFVAGIFDGQFTMRGSKPDVIIDNKKYSVKFIDNPSKAPELGSYKNSLINNSEIDKFIKEYKGLTRIFRLKNDEIIEGSLTALDLKKLICDIVLSDVDSWIIAYPNSKKNPSEIIYCVFDRIILENMLLDGRVVSPKGGLDNYYSIALSATFKNNSDIIKSYITIPNVTISELKSCLPNNDEYKWGFDVFGNMVNKMRPDVLKYIKRNADPIIKKLNEFK